MKVVLDSNVIIAAFASHGLCNALFESCLINHQVFSSKKLLSEVSRGLQKKIRLPSSTVREIMAFLDRYTERMGPLVLSHPISRDPKDNHIMGLAIVAQVNCLVSGDHDLLALKTFQRIPLLSPRQFWEILQEEK